MWDLVLRGGELILPGGKTRADLAVSGGQIAEIAPEISEVGIREIGLPLTAPQQQLKESLDPSFPSKVDET
jgi:dihydroorotase-like cyclic amidohydrolase